MRLRALCAVTVLLFSCLAVGAQEHFQFAWLTDLHVGGGTGAEDLRAVVADVNRRRSCRFAVVSGDVSEMGATAELRLAKRLLDSLLVPYFIIPGNHDTKWSESGCTAFSRLWGSECFSFTQGEYHFIGLHQGPVMRMGDGHLSRETLRWVDSVLARIPLETPLIVVTHYPIDESVDNWYELLDRLRQRDVPAILCGHGHANRAMEFEGIPGVMGRSTLRGTGQAGYTIVRVTKDSLIFYEAMVGVAELRQWHLLPLRRRAQEPRSRPIRPDFAVNAQYPDVRPVWSYQGPCTIAAPPAVGEGVVVVGDAGGVIHCCDLAMGEVRWKFQTGGPVHGRPDIAEGCVVCGAGDSCVYCLRTCDGSLRWRVFVGAPVVGSVRIEHGVVFVGDGHGAMHALELASGRTLWTFRGAGGFIETRPLLYRGKVIFGAWDGYLYAVDASGGREVWRWQGGRPGRLYSPAACWPVAAKGKVFIVAPDRHMTALDAESGREVWRTGRHRVREAIGLSEDSSRVYVRCMVDTVVAIASAAEAPEPVWLSPCGYGYDIAPSMPVEHEGLLLFGTKNGYVYALDAATGAVAWRHRLGVTVVNTVTPAGHRKLAATDADGRVALLAW
ncbi:MAG: PQQ-binding-like beta-propeller repeat protein [candidate division KSB1 bacterium]|nr:PQQ-binding-like beta-propeller repeat protein [candidate division KSB1 bacterium]